jgi:perosamine synthetase
LKWKIPLFKIYNDDDDIIHISNVIKRGSYWATGPEIQEFEQKLSEYIGSKYSTTFNSGTSALHALLLAYGIRKGDEVIVPSFTFISTANAPLFVGAKPVFAEIEEKNYGLDPEDVKERITIRTKVIMPIHYGGCPCLIRELKQIAEDYNLLLIEDAAESLGAKIKNETVGTFGDAAMFSFCQNKIISTGEGGAISTNSNEIYEKLKLIRSHGRSETVDYFSSTENSEYDTLGYNFRMSSITASLGLTQLKKVDEIIRMRQRNAEYLTSKLLPIKEIPIQIPSSDYFHVYQMYTIMVDKHIRNHLTDYLSTKGIQTKVYFNPIHSSIFYEKSFGYKAGDFPITEKISEQVLTLPMYPKLSFDEIDYIASSIKNFFEA